ncbi:hypothetical protein BCR44DRAFT_1432448 [Catenaria anguillulae PL171]|uniref:Transcription initiation factor TFIID subunit 8 n=1 Tax=Catenaria anguillulae PL171 TaxID=765915 RepID=A0A1Y2HQU6_9FUNG|nr:hypothetical protein BCR44DRAFT_1432448 [Catenaria anguillulae PL171]
MNKPTPMAITSSPPQPQPQPPPLSLHASTIPDPQHSAHLWVFRSLVHQLAAGPHFASADPHAVHVLARLFARYLSDLACFAASYAEASGRARVQFSDLGPTLDRVGLPLADLHAQLLASAPAARASHAAYKSSPPDNDNDTQSPSSSIAPFTPLCATSPPSNPLPILAPTYGHDTKLVPVSVLDAVTSTQSIHPSYPIIVDPEKHPLVVKKLQALPLRPSLPASSSSGSMPAFTSQQQPLATVIVPRTQFPPHVPEACPKFPPPHTYKRTPVMPLHATHTSRAPLLADQRKLMEANLRRLMTAHPKLFSSGATSPSAPPAESSEPNGEPTPAPVSASAAGPRGCKPRLSVLKALTLSQPAAMWWKHPPAELPQDILDELAPAPEVEQEGKDTEPLDMDMDSIAVVANGSPRRAKSPTKSPPPTTTSPAPPLATVVPPASSSSATTSPSSKRTLRSPTPIRARSPPPAAPQTAPVATASYPRASSPLATSSPIQPTANTPSRLPILDGDQAPTQHSTAMATAGQLAQSSGSSPVMPAASSLALVDDASSEASSSASASGTGAGNRPRVSSGGILRLKIKPLGAVGPLPPANANANANGGGQERG